VVIIFFTGLPFTKLLCILYTLKKKSNEGFILIGWIFYIALFLIYT